MNFTIRMHCVVQHVSKDVTVVSVCKVCFRYKWDIYVLTENKDFNFLRVFGQFIGIPGCYFEWLDHYIILVTNIISLLNIASIFSMYSFIIFYSSCITLVISCSGLGVVIFFCVSWFFECLIICFPILRLKYMIFLIGHT